MERFASTFLLPFCVNLHLSYFPDLRAETAAKMAAAGPQPGKTKDDAYQQFMREMEGLL